MTQAPVSCQPTDTISPKPGSNGDQAVNVALLPCPFCGGTDLEFDLADIDGWVAHVKCTDCSDMIGPMSEFKYDDKADAEKDAAEVWNRRAAPSLPQDVAALVATLNAGVTTEPGCSHPIWSDVEKADAAMRSASSLILSQSSTIASAREVMQWVEARLYGSPVNMASEIKERIRSVARGGK